MQVVGSQRIASQPYAPSWVDVLQAQVTRLPWSPWVSYATFWLVLVAIEFLAQSRTGTAVSSPWPWILLAFGIAPYSVALMDQLDRAAAAALERFGEPTGDGAWPGGARYHLTTKPALGTAIATLIGIGFGMFQRFWVTSPYIEQLGFTRSGWLHYFELLAVPALGWGLIGVLVYHVARQVILVRRLYRQQNRVDVFSAHRFHAFAGYAAGMAIGMVGPAYLWLLIYPDIEASSVEGLTLATIAILTGLGFGVFLFPLWEAHRRLTEAKAERLAYVTRLLDSELEKLHASMERDERQVITHLSAGTGALAAERRLVEGASTWPWEASLFWRFATAVLLPLGLYAVQQIIGRAI